MDVPDNSLECFFLSATPSRPPTTTSHVFSPWSSQRMWPFSIALCDVIPDIWLFSKSKLVFYLVVKVVPLLNFCWIWKNVFWVLVTASPNPVEVWLFFTFVIWKRDSSRIQPERKWIKKLQIYMLLANCLCIEDTQDTCLKGM